MHGDFRDRPLRSAGLGMWDIAAAVCIGVLAANAITWGVVELRLRWELHQAGEAAQRVVERLKEEGRRSAERVEAEARRRAVAVEEAAERDRRTLAAQQHAEDAAKRAALAEQERRARAWSKFYRPSKGCAESTVSVVCANEHIRAQREFARRYAAGEL